MPRDDPEQLIRLRRRVALAMCWVGGLVSTSGIWSTQHSMEGRVAQAAMSALLFALGVCLLVTRRTSLGGLRAVVLASIGGLSVLMSAADPIGMTPFFYLWPVVFVAYFDSRRVLGITLAWMSVTLVPGVLVNPHTDLKVDVVVGTIASVTGMALLVTAMRERDRQQQARLFLAARTDPLTGLLNRRAFDAGLGDLLVRARPVIVLFDIDHFKQVNDVHGHQTGDLVLTRVAEALRREAPVRALICRHGGEEIVAALPAGGTAGGQRLAQAVAARLVGDRDGVPGVAISYGVADAAAVEVAGMADLMRRADQAMYAAKDAGRGRGAWWASTEVLQVDAAGAAPAARVTAPV